MGIKKLTPASPARRYQTYLTRDELTPGVEPHEPLLAPKKRISGRNNDGHITMRRRGGGNKRQYRIIDFKRDKASIGKAGRTRWICRRPKVRRVAMNPIDHPHGGGEGKTSGGRHPVTP